MPAVQRPASPTRTRTQLPRWVVPAAITVAVAAGIGLRFWTRSHLWLDEALTVNISRLPFRRIPTALRHDGAPPLHYLMLHAWIRVFGTSDVAVRSLSGVIGVLALPVAWVMGRALGGRRTAWVTVLLLASSPFAIRYSTEARMYSELILLSLVGWIAMERVLARPTLPRLALLTVVSTLLLYTHYWSLYLLAVVEVMLLRRWLRGPGRDGARRAFFAIAAGGVLFLPWLPILVFQLRHTGTPWAKPATFRALVNAVSEFGGGTHDEGRGLSIILFALGGLGLLGRAVDARHIELDLRTRPRGRGAAVAVVGTLGLAIAVGLVSGSAYEARYAAVVFGLFLVLVVLGTTALADRRIQALVIVAAVGFGLAGGIRNVVTDRTQAGQVARALQSHVQAGDVVGYCPDQLGPGVSRLLPRALTQLTFPRGARPERVDWVDYADRSRAGDADAFARLLDDRAGPHAVWLVWSSGYRSLDAKCEQVVNALSGRRGPGTEFVHLDAEEFYEHEDLLGFPAR